MALDVAVPEPPDLSARGRPRDFEWDDETRGSEDFRREELEALLQDGAWREGFEEWAQYTDLNEAEFHIVDTLGLFQAFDFYWHPTDDRLRVDAPSVPDDWRSREATAEVDSSTVSQIDGALEDLGRAVQEALEGYLDRSEASSDATWGEDAYGDRDE